MAGELCVVWVACDDIFAVGLSFDGKIAGKGESGGDKYLFAGACCDVCDVLFGLGLGFGAVLFDFWLCCIIFINRVGLEAQLCICG